MFSVPWILALLFIVVNSEDISTSSSVNLHDHSTNLSTPIIEVLCFIDFDTYKLHAGETTGEKAVTEVENYFLPFWKNVDHYFSLLNIRISLKGIIIARTREEENVFLNSQKNRLFADAFCSLDTLIDLGKYIYSSTENLPIHDITIVITQSVLCKEKKLVSEKNSTESLIQNSCHVDGNVATHLNGVCSESSSIAIIRDTNKMYTGVRSAVFAIGQLLGFPKDGENNAEECESKDGYFMSDNINFDSPYKFEWSNCSIREFQKILRSVRTSDTWLCLFDESHEEEIDFLKAPFPGEILSLDDYCKKMTEYKACNYDDVCASLTCSSGEYCGQTIKGPAIEGSWCGSNDTATMRCKYGKCVFFFDRKFDEYDAIDGMIQFLKINK
ncbi:hypothetical protein HCN44_003611 [Aphidius gifuensis]|uniref:Peptidase M12B domain-containing protein n=1 Tax=Aphidius gifuensis TaxID=684658 RepID=A0A834XIJ7_APHGI|nr:uncharacterized protein LOC122858872 [Aphidius gifuensis]KAF7987748.1 hypothetical protein HCN44_003611 [Aphidius gifuensis]